MQMENYDAFADPEQRYRRRYVDLTVNDHVKKRLSNAPN
jgi:lysyl-tRNA synthetase class 2